ncbi:MAG TPA: phosphoribosylaminoimidazolesuccinocarboxamide synthase, partial [Actinoplanes sp.]
MDVTETVPCLVDPGLSGPGPVLRGKVRDTWHLPGGRSVVVTTDRQSAFDEPLPPIPHKGRVLNLLSAFWFEQTADICRNHLIDVLDDNTALVETLRMIPVEVV